MYRYTYKLSSKTITYDSLWNRACKVSYTEYRPNVRMVNNKWICSYVSIGIEEKRYDFFSFFKNIIG